MAKHLKQVVQLETDIYIHLADHEEALGRILTNKEIAAKIPVGTANLTAALVAVGYAASHTMDGSIRWVKKLITEICLCEEKQLWEALAPVVVTGSYITFGIEDGEVWAWVFVNKQLYEIDFSFYRQVVVKGIAADIELVT